MTKAIESTKLQEALERTGNAWLFQFWEDKAGKVLEGMRRALGKFIREYHQRFPAEAKPDPFRLLEDNPDKGAAFFQPDTFDLSTEMQIMLWKVLSGSEIFRVDFTYTLDSDSHLRVTLRSPTGKKDAFEGRGPSDYLVLRHFGSFVQDGRLRLDGYYAASQSESASE
jgi:hypothetical protein